MVLPASNFKRYSWHSSRGNKSCTCSSLGFKLLMETFRQSSSSFYSIYSSAPTDFSKSNSCMRTSIKEFSHFDSKERRFLKKTKLNFNSTAIKSRRSNKRLIASMALHQRSSYSSLNNQFLSLSQQQSLLSLKKTFKSHLSHVSTRGLSHGL